MSFHIFKKMVKCVLARYDQKVNPVFVNEDGAFKAYVEDLTISGCLGSKRISARWGSGHQAMIPEEVCYG